MAFHNRYWSCTKFADWVRGTPKINMGTSEQWDDWHQNAKAVHPWRWWLAEEGLDLVQDFITWPFRKLYDIKYYINNRWVSKTHALTAHARDIKPGEWSDVGDRFLFCLFNELQDYVELELAWWQIAWNDNESKKYDAPFWAKGIFRWRTWRCPQAGLDNLTWQSSLCHREDEVGDKTSLIGKPTPQAVVAQEIIDLYTWWTQTYRNRPDPYEVSGWTQICEEGRAANNGRLSFSDPKDPDLKRRSKQALKIIHKLEQDYTREEDQMLQRLVKVRRSLWT
jgi:hypothetical protein